MTDAVYVSSITTPGGTYYFPFDDHQWAIEIGYTARVQKWKVPAQIAAAVLTDLIGLTGAAREVTLTFGDPSDTNPNATVTVSRVITLGVEAADNIQYRYLCFTDVLFYFEFAWCEWDFNVRRRVGDTRVLGATLVTGLTPVPTVAYSPWSINDPSGTPSPYTWTDAITRVNNHFAVGGNGRPAVSFAYDSQTSTSIATQIIQELNMSSEGPAALARAIESAPGAGIFVDRAGTVHVCDATQGAEGPYLATITTVPDGGLWDHGSIVFIDNSALRPVPTGSTGDGSAYRVLFDMEIEVRLDYNASGSDVPSGSDWSQPTGNNPHLIPCLQVTDISLTVPAGTYYGVGTIASRDVGQGTWLPQDQAFAAWGSKTIASDTPGPITLPQLTDDFVASHWFNGTLELYSVGNAVAVFDPVWGARIKSLQASWRTDFLISPGFWEPVRRGFEVRCGIWDTVTGTRAPSPVYCNFHLWPSNNKASNQDQVFGYDVTDFADSGLLANSFPSGFLVEIVDQELGIIHIDRDLSRFPGHSQVAPSPVVPGTNFTGGPGFNEAILQKLVRNVDDGDVKAWRLAVILSLVPAAPNSTSRLFEVQVSGGQAVTLAGIAAPSVGGTAPDVQTRSRLADARVPWPVDDNDTDVGNILACFPPAGTADIFGTPAVTPMNLAQELTPLAQAIAATHLMSTLDHYQGTASIPINQLIVPIGSLTRVVHRVKDRRLVTEMTCTRAPGKFHVEQFLAGTARDFILKQSGAVR